MAQQTNQSRLRTLGTHTPQTVRRHVMTRPNRRDESRGAWASLNQAVYENVTQWLPFWATRNVIDDPGAGGFGGGQATGTVNDRRGGKNLPVFWSEIDLRGFRILARHLCNTNAFAIGFMSLLKGYHIRKGFGWQACLKGAHKTPYATGYKNDPLVSKAQAILDQWRDLNQWPIKSREAFLRWRRDGEVFVRFFQQGSHKLSKLRFLEPEQIGSPTGDVEGESSFGIACEDGDVETPVAYHAWRVDDPLHGDWIDADRVVHAKANVDAVIKRGVTDFYPLTESLDNTRRLLHSMLATAIKQARVAWREKIPNASSSQAIAAVPEYANTATNRLQPYSISDDVSRAFREQFGRVGINGYSLADVVRVEGNREFDPGPTMNGAPQYIQVEQAVLRACGVRWNFPEYFSGDASNNNMASSIVAGSPFTVTVEGNQLEWGACFEKLVAMRVLELARDAGLLSWEEFAKLDVEMNEPAVATADPQKDTSVYTQQLQAKIVSLDTVRQKLGYDPQHEAEGIAKDQQAQQPQQPQIGAPTPLGESKTDANVIANLVVAKMQESQVKLIEREEGEVWQGESGKWFTLKNGHTVPAKAPGQQDSTASSPTSKQDDAQPSPRVQQHQEIVSQWLSGSDLPEDTKSAYNDSMVAALGALPEKTLQRALGALKDGKTKVQFYATTDDVKRAYGKRIQGDVAGFVKFDGARNTDAELHLDGAGGGHLTPQVYAHELGHLADLHFAQNAERHGGKIRTEPASEQPEWQKVWNAEIAKPKKELLSRYAMTSPAEGFAELIRVIARDGLDRTEQRFPKSIKVLKEFGIV